MKKKQLGKIKSELLELRKHASGKASSVFEALAARLGREKFNIGKEPTWVRKKDPALSPPLSIPHHSKDMPIGTAKSIINQLLNDCDDWQIYLDSADEGEDDEQED